VRNTSAAFPIFFMAASASLESTWHTVSIADTCRQLDVDPSYGLSEKAAQERLLKNGPNELRKSAGTSAWRLLLEQLKNILVIILIIAVALSEFLGHEVEAIAIGIIILFAVLLGFVQEYRAEKAIEALRRMAAPTATVRRGGKEIVIPSREVVTGDIIFLKAGDLVPADARMTEAINIKANEAALTGESLSVEKHGETIPTAHIPVGDRRNMVHAGTAITYGRGTAVITSTGMHTEFGKIAGLLETVETSRTPLQQNLDVVGKKLAMAAFAIVGIISAIGLYQRKDIFEIFIFGVALAVAVVPEALPAVVTISLAIGVQKMVKRNALVRRLPAVETLGSTTIICSDKTGTLTKDEMTIRTVRTDGRSYEVTGSGYDPIGKFVFDGAHFVPSGALLELLTGGVLCNDSELIKENEEWHVRGDPTEGAMVVAAAKGGLKKADLVGRFPRIGEIPFTSETKRMTTLHDIDGTKIAYTKGAAEIVLASCTMRLTEKGEEKMDMADRESLLAEAKTMAEHALRVLAIARKSDATLENAEHGMTLLGLVGMIDPPRVEAKEAIQKCKQAGIKVVMITGDHPVTAYAIARELQLLGGGRTVTGAELDAMDDVTFEREVEHIDVYARVSPAHKLKVVTALQAKGHIVAMTGDGVNDAPALKKADIGIAMGITGTDVTKEAAAMMLTDDNFASIVAAVEEGRGIFGNIKKYLMYLLSSNIGEILIMTVATLLGLPLPLSAIQILYVNLATDGLPALALAVDPASPDLMKRQPRNPRHSIFTRPVLFLMITSGVWSMILNIGLYIWALESGRSQSEAMTMTFVALVLIEFLKAYNFRSDRASVFQKPFANRWLNIAVLWELVLLGLVVYVPFLQAPFGTYALPRADWLIIIALSLTIIPVLELGKWIVRKGWVGALD